MKAFVGIQIVMGLSPKNEIEDYWETWWLSQTKFSEIMPRNRFELLTSFLHFEDNTASRPKRGEDGFDFLWKVKRMMNMCEARHQEVLCPSKNLSIDESIIAFKGRVAIRQY